MKNPFPGVNPFIETADLWVGFHNALITNIGQLLNPLLNPRGYAAVIEKRVELVDHSGDESGNRQPDLLVLTGDRTSTAPPATSAISTTATVTIDVEPADVMLPEYESHPVAYIEIRSYPDRELVTTVEVLSPANKSGSSRGGYLAKRGAVLATTVNLVEIDLLLAGRRPPVIGSMPPGDFVTLVSRGDNRPHCHAYAWSIRRSLPRLPVPLKSGDADILLDLATSYKTTYDGGPYSMLLSYDRPLESLSDGDRRWAMDRAAERIC